MNKATVLITGASGGIGYELAKVFAENGFSLVLVARSKNILEGIAENFKKEFGAPVTVIEKDLAVPGAPQQIFDQLKSRNIDVEILVNNAGFGIYGEFAESSTEEQLGIVALNITALVHLTKLFLPGMIERKSGKILNVASTAAFQPGPLMSIYYASKAFVLHFSEAISNELESTGVTVTALCPGPTQTNFSKRAHTERITLFRKNTMDAKTVALIGYHGLMKGQTIVIPGFQNKLLARLVGFMPRAFVVNVVRKIQENKIK